VSFYYGKKPLGKQRRKWVDDINMDLGDIGYGGMDSIDLPQDRNQCRALVDAVMSLWVP
jgi:hypothetical protein